MLQTKTSISTDLSDIHEKIMDRQRLEYEDGLRLFASGEILTIGYLANIVRERLNKNIAYYVKNRHINYTNICKNSCRFCAFGRTQESKGAYLLSIDEIRNKASQIIEDGTTELHIVGGLHPDIEFDYYLKLIRSLHEHFPRVHLKAFTAVEIVHFAEMSGATTTEILGLLKSAGLSSLPGGGAEIFATHIRNELCPEKISGRIWLDTMREAHNLGLKSNATVLYGHIESDDDRVNHMLQLRELQDDMNGFMSFVPLAFHPKNTELEGLSRTQGILDLKMLAISRLMLDNFDHIKAYWIMLGIKLAQVSLNFGVDDIDGTVIEEKITHSAGAQTPESLTANQIISLIEESGHEPVERDALYNSVNPAR